MTSDRVIKHPIMDRWWQLKILEEIKGVPDDRTINWYWSEAGNIGKTTFCKYLTDIHGAVPVCGRGNDVRNAICTHLKVEEETPGLVVFPIPRSTGSDYISYEAIENIKDMYFYSGKYEGGAVCGPCPHLYVFANFEPDEHRLSGDRWNIINIDVGTATTPPSWVPVTGNAQQLDAASPPGSPNWGTQPSGGHCVELTIIDKA